MKVPLPLKRYLHDRDRNNEDELAEGFNAFVAFMHNDGKNIDMDELNRKIISSSQNSAFNTGWNSAVLMTIKINQE